MMWFDWQSQWYAHYAGCTTEIVTQGVDNSTKKKESTVKHI